MSDLERFSPSVSSAEKNTIQVALAVYDPTGKYSRHAGVAMTSLFSRTSNPVCVTILCDKTLSKDNRDRFQKTADAFKQEVRFIDVSHSISNIGPKLDEFARSFSRGTLFRLTIPDVLDVGKVIYLDCDVAVNLDIFELWNIDIEDLSLAAIFDAAIIRARRKLHSRVRAWAMRYDGEKYFNAGVLLMNLDRIRREKCNLIEEAIKFFTRYYRCAEFPDQDFLNVFFGNDVRHIDERFNRISDHHNIDNSILHLTGRQKPWVAPLCEPRDYLYWNTFARSEWQDQTVDAMLEMHKNNDHIHNHTSDCWRHILMRWKKDILINNGVIRWFKDVKICFIELCYRFFDKLGWV
jgi:lipopolysaccharide biosynthesis glycosyltransferase